MYYVYAAEQGAGAGVVHHLVTRLAERRTSPAAPVRRLPGR
ncbi:hypothetical protein [Streptomyces sp. WELS2]|nr:hypothetical protein [Streptomyces sp. WELS2]